MKILVTGGAGYIGSHTVNYLIKDCNIKPENIVVFDNLVYGHKEYLPNGITFVKGDLLHKRDIQNVFKQHDIESVIHFAAYAFVGESMQNPSKYFTNNLMGGINLLDCMVEYNCKHIVFSSTCAVYGVPTKMPISENNEKKPINPYGESKLQFEKILSWYDKIYGIKSIKLRYFNAAGAGYGIGEDHVPEPHLIPLTIFAAIGLRKNITVFGTDYNTHDGTCIRDYLHVKDLASAHYKSLQYLKTYNQSDVFNLGTSSGTSVKEIICYVQKLITNKINIIYGKRRDGDPPVLVADYDKAKKRLNWSPKIGIQEIIEDAYNWHMKSL